MPHSTNSPGGQRVAKKSRLRASLKAMVALAILAAPAAAAGPALAASTIAVDPTTPGPLAVTFGDYHLPPSVDPQVDTTVVTELWARVYRPVALSGPHPVIIILHGNHGTCGHFVTGRPGRVDDNSQYTTTGTCPDGYVVTPNHLGYAYIAERLASYGYIVVSINANRGINAGTGAPADSGLNMRRGRLVLRHLELLSKWNRQGGAPATLGFDPTGLLDFSHIGLMGHSRGGEGQLAAYTLYSDPNSTWPALINAPVHFDALFELAPVDGQTARTFYAFNLPWSVLLPMCDGDVYNLQGLKVFDRTEVTLAESMPTPKATYTVWGANHDFYNTEWQQSDSQGCVGAGNNPLFDINLSASGQQRMTAVYAMMAMFRGHVGPNADPSLAQLFNPSYNLPTGLKAITNITRGFSDSADVAELSLFREFSSSTKLAFNVAVSKPILPNHDTTLTSVALTWPKKADNPKTPSYNALWVPFGQIVAQPYGTLEFRVSLQCGAGSIDINSCSGGANPLNANQTTDFSIAAMLPGGQLSKPVLLSKYVRVQGPVGGAPLHYHPVLQTVRIPLADLGLSSDDTIAHGAQKPVLQGVTLRFDSPSSPTGAIYLSSVRLTDPVPVVNSALVAMQMQKAQVKALAQVQNPVPTDPQSPLAPPPVDRVAPPGVVASLSYASAAPTIGPAPLVTGGAKPQVAGARTILLTLKSPEPVEVKNSLMTLNVGGKALLVGGYGDNGDTRTVVFSIEQQDFADLPDQAPITLINGGTQQSYGVLSKGQLK